jgi:hypothetical protein
MKVEATAGLAVGFASRGRFRRGHRFACWRFPAPSPLSPCIVSSQRDCCSVTNLNEQRLPADCLRLANCAIAPAEARELPIVGALRCCPHQDTHSTSLV